MKKYLLFLFLLLLFCIPALLPLIHKGFFLSDDGNWMVIRFSAFYEVLGSGEFPVRFLTRLNNGYGYPVSNFLYPLFMYLGTPIHAMGAGFVDTIKIIFAGSIVFSAIFTYLWLRKIFDNIASFVGGVFYTFFPYHLYDIYKRGSVGEALSLSIVPFILWQIERKNLGLTSLGLSLLILSHNTLALLFMPLIFIYAFLRSKKQLKFILTAMFLGLGVSAFFWIPAIYDTRYTVFAGTRVSEFQNYLLNIKDFGIVGLVSLVLLFCSSLIIFIKKQIKKDDIFFFSVILSFVIIFLTSSYSKFLWEFIPFTNLIQFPFRLISILLVLLTFQLGFLINLTQKSKKLFISVVFLVLILISAKPYLNVTNYQYFSETFYSTNQDTTTVRKEYMPKWVKDKDMEYVSSRVENLSGEESVSVNKVSAREITFNTFLAQSRDFRVNIAYFPGWNLYVNGSKENINYEKSGLIEFSLDKGQNNVEILFQETTVRVLSDLLSIISLLGLLFLIYLIKIKKIKI